MSRAIGRGSSKKPHAVEKRIHEALVGESSAKDCKPNLCKILKSDMEKITGKEWVRIIGGETGLRHRNSKFENERQRF